MLFRGYTLVGLDAPLALYRMHSSAISAGDRAATCDVLPILRHFHERFPDLLDWRPSARHWLRQYLKRRYLPGERETVRKYIDYWDIGTPAVRFVAGARWMPERLYKRALKTLLKR